MTADGETFGLVGPRPGIFPGGDRLLLNAIPYYEPLDSGTLITTSGLGGVYPRGIPIGEVLEVHQEEGRWNKEYWLRPIVEPGSVTHVLVVRPDSTTEQLLRLFEEGGAGPLQETSRVDSGGQGG
jgi:rod shape-determining protein MreC